MKKHALLAALAATSLAACASDRSIVDAPADSPSRPRVVGRPPSFLTSDNLGTVAQHGGGVFASSGSPTAYIIYWGSRWSTSPGDIVSTVDGPIVLGDFGPPHQNGACDHEGQCVLLALWADVGEHMREHLDSYTLADCVGRARNWSQPLKSASEVG